MPKGDGVMTIQAKVIRFFWDFYGPDAKTTAEHHCHHVAEFVRLHALELETGVLEVKTGHFSAYVDLCDLPLALDESAQSEENDQERIADQVGRTLRPNRYELI